MMRPRRAPSAKRMAISRRRAVARTSSRLATLAHAMRRTSSTAPRSTTSVGRTRLVTTSWKRSTEKLPPSDPRAFGNRLRNSAADAFIRSCACSSVTPGLIRAMARK